MQPPATITAAIGVLASTPAVLRALLQPLPDDLLSSPGREGWSARDVLAHLLARQQPAIVGRVTAILSEPGGAIPDVPDDLMEVAPYRARDLATLLDEFARGRADAVALLHRISPDQLQLRGLHSAVGAISIADVIHHVAYHDLVHISQAAALAARPIEPLRGALRPFR